ncbi:hypothetical protein FS837_001720 [Tulasnella sp. UAMH 9824]|nr:hypothetical protein FS837_001720 [Tulasnella sp. UAMH 9824]
MTGKGMLALVGTPATQAIMTICTPRFLLNLRAAYFSRSRNPLATQTRGTRHAETEGTAGTVGAFRPATFDLADEGGGWGRDETELGEAMALDRGSGTVSASDLAST